jgi:hypothetical protein
VGEADGALLGEDDILGDTDGFADLLGKKEGEVLGGTDGAILGDLDGAALGRSVDSFEPNIRKSKQDAEKSRKIG